MIREDWIRQAAQEYEQALDAQLPAPEPHEFSSRFQRRMKARLTQAEHGKAYLTVRRVACIVLVALLCGSALMAVPPVRACVLKWLVSPDQVGNVWYLANGRDDTPVDGVYGIGWVPEGFTLDDRYQVEQSIRYRTPDRRIVELTWMTCSNYGLGVSHWADEVYKTRVNGRPADMYVRTKVWSECTILWTSEDENILFILTTNCDAETTVRIAESVYPVEP